MGKAGRSLCLCRFLFRTTKKEDDDKKIDSEPALNYGGIYVGTIQFSQRQKIVGKSGFKSSIIKMYSLL